MPLDRAIYSPSQDKIYAVRGQWVYKFNAESGAREASYRFTDGGIFGESSIVEVGSFLYASYWRTLDSGWSNTTNDLYKIPPDFSSSTGLGIGLKGPAFLALTGGYIYALLVSLQGGQTNGEFWAFDPLNYAGTNSNYDYLSCAYTGDISLDTANGRAWMAFDGRSQRFAVASMTVPLSDYIYELAGPALPGPIIGGAGICYCSANGKAYGVMGRNSIIKINANEGVTNCTHSTLSILQAAAKPFRIKYNPNDALIYVPTFSGDTVEILNPATDTITAVKTGFTAPFDCVFTPAKKWAVQNSSAGLREIT